MLSGKTANNGLSMNCRNKLVTEVGKVCTASYLFKNVVTSGGKNNLVKGKVYILVENKTAFKLSFL